MAWIKVPPENRPLFLEALPADWRIETIQMFGGIAAKVHGRIFAGLFARSTALLLSDADKQAALALEGAGPFDPMGRGRAAFGAVMMPEALMDDAIELRSWMRRAFEYAVSLPEKPPKAPRAKRPAKGSTGSREASAAKERRQPRAGARKRARRPKGPSSSG